jgi:hypothetical protein
MSLARLTSIVLALAGIAAASALADGGGPGVPGTTESVFAPNGLMYTAAAHADRTTVSIWRDGRKTRSVKIAGSYGVPVATPDGAAEGVSHDGRTLVLAWAGGPTAAFAVLDARTLHLRRVVKLPGQFSFDALSPHGRTLYLIQHVASRFSNRYYVRAYDLARDRLLRKIVFDRREKWGLMSGQPVTRATGKSGRWVYTLYTRPGGHPFVHALDSVARRAVCVDLPWRGSQDRIWQMSLRLSPGKLVVHRGKTRAAVIDTRTFRVSS